MWIQVRSMDGSKVIRLDSLSKLTKVDDLREMLIDPFSAPPECQRLFYRGKQLVNGHTLFDYDVGLNAVVQILVRKAAPVSETPAKSSDTVTKAEECTSDKENQAPECEDTTSSHEVESGELNSTFKLGDVIDARDEVMGAWFEAEIIKITKKSRQPLSDSTPPEKTDVNSDDKEEETCESKSTEEIVSKHNGLNNSGSEDDGVIYHVKYEGTNPGRYEDDPPALLPVSNIRPRARQKVTFSEVKEGDRLMVNYNYDEPGDRGYWYDAVVTEKRNTRTIKELICTVNIGKDLIPMEKCLIPLKNDIFKIEKTGTQLNKNDYDGTEQTPTKRSVKPECDNCGDNPKRKCKFCACCVCGDKKAPEKQLVCDECDESYHLWCLNPPLSAVPEEDDWYCPKCKVDKSEVVQAGEMLKHSKKKSKMVSASTESKRDWGKGMACMGRTKQCNIVPPNHYGPIPGVEVGTQWKFRVQASEAGVHRPHVSGISGREQDGAYSIVLSGGYEDDKDDGDEFTYTGSGGRDLSGNKRTAEQSCDQQLTRMNMALAKNCNAPPDKKNGATAKNWKSGKPVRVVRNYKGHKHSKYAPEEGNRYDGIYKIVKYWPEKGKSGFLVWRYLFKRDDPIEPPWTKEGKKRIEQHGLTIQYPDGWLESQKAKEKLQEEKENEKKSKRKSKANADSDTENESPKKSKSTKKRKRVVSSSDDDSGSPVKKKTSRYDLDSAVEANIKRDEANKKIWDEAQTEMDSGAQKFLAKVEELFLCICCQDLVYQPITTTCFHNVCKNCLQRSFKAEVYCCPACRTDLGKECSQKINKPLSTALLALFPGYENGR